jgi:integrase/recombinase XerD
LRKKGVYDAVTVWAKQKGYYNTNSDANMDHFSPHNLRHCFTTYLLENGMMREYVKELRGDARKDAVDLYNHIPSESLREAYLAAMPQFGL